MCQHCDKEISYPDANLYNISVNCYYKYVYDKQIILCEDCLKKLKELLNNFVLF